VGRQVRCGRPDCLERTITAGQGATESPATDLAAFIYRRDRAIVIAGIVVLTAISWVYLIRLPTMPGEMGMDAGMAMQMANPNPAAWTMRDFVFMFWMWAVMMLAMMLPSATPMILLVTRVNRQRRQQRRPFTPTATFTAGYVLVWTGFSALATTVNWGLHQAGIMTSMMGATGALVGGALLIGAGLFQFTPLKHACLDHCRSPMSWLMSSWKDGWAGAVGMGMRHGLYCLGCCWMLMALLFALGVMNLPWIAVLAGFVLLEKVIPVGAAVSRLSGLALIAWGAWLSATVS
jgi:predicted metal-binding membrane protein